MLKQFFVLITISFTSLVFSQNEFITTWETTTASETITIPTESNSIYNYTVDWGDGTIDSGITGNATHIYTVADIYTVKISGDFPRIYFQGTTNNQKIVSIENWGLNTWESMEGAFFGCSNLKLNALDTPNLTGVTNMRNMFRDAILVNQDISNWNVSTIINMNRMFKGATGFNQNLGNWIIGNVIDMGSMFANTPGLSTTNYDNTLLGWISQPLQNTVVFTAGPSQYCSGESARDILINTYGWVINDGGKDPFCDSFISTWETTNVTNIYSSNSNQVAIPTNGSGYNYSIDWGDGIIDNNVTGDITHTYATEGEYTIKINGAFPNIRFNNTGDREKILSIEQWGSNEWTSMRSAFEGCSNLVINATDSPDLSQVTDMTSMFRYAINFNNDISNWDISTVTNMTDILLNTSFTTENYDKLLLEWSLQNVKPNVNFSAGVTKYCLGNDAKLVLTQAPNNWVITDYGLDVSCEKPLITKWETSIINEEIHIPIAPGSTYDYTIDWGDGTTDTNVTTEARHTYADSGMHSISITGNFARIYFYDSDTRQKLHSVEQWGTTAWESMEDAFRLCTNFNVTAIDTPNLSNATSMKGMFYNASSFNQDISSWNVSNITNMSYMFASAETFNQSLSNWNVSNVTDMSYMFSEAYVFNADISNWNTSNVITMRSMFIEAYAFNSDISNWNVGNVINMKHMFREATQFNSELSDWNTSNVIEMDYLFHKAINFNQDISSWNLSSLVDARDMFEEAISFNQDIGNWDVSNIKYMNYMFNKAESFNQDLSNWNVSNVIEFTHMFEDAISFDQDLSNWDLSNALRMSNMLDVTAVSLSNYDAILIGWATDSSGVPNDGVDDIPSNINFGVNSKYCTGETARNLLTTPIIDGGYNWSIDDLGNGCDVSLDITVYLQGASINPNIGEEILMRDDLRIADVIPVTSPYADGLTCDPSVFTVIGVDAIVDWIQVELRDATDSTFIVASQSALLQRDGDVVAIDGVSPITFAMGQNIYYVSIQHRSHLGIMSSNEVSLIETGTTVIDFTDASNQITYGTNAQTTFNMPVGIVGMWAGNVNGDASVRYLGSSNETTSLKDIVLTEGGDNLHSFMGYSPGDVDMNGEIRYLGSGNDAIIIKDIILNHPSNQASPSNLYSIEEQLSEN